MELPSRSPEFKKITFENTFSRPDRRDIAAVLRLFLLFDVHLEILMILFVDGLIDVAVREMDMKALVGLEIPE